MKAAIIVDFPFSSRCADGLAGSCSPGTEPNELEKDLSLVIRQEYSRHFSLNTPKSFSLEPWAKQGVLLLNRNITCEEDDQFAHENKGWGYLCTEVLSYIKTYKQGTPIVLIGSDNKAYKKFLHDSNPCIWFKRPNKLQHKNVENMRGSNFLEWIDAHLEKPLDWKLQ